MKIYSSPGSRSACELISTKSLLLLSALSLAGCGAGTGTGHQNTDASEQIVSDSVDNKPVSPTSQPNELERTPRIVNGTEVRGNQYPWMVALLNRSIANSFDAQFCGGSLIAKRWVLTAAHCVESARASGIETLTGKPDLDSNGGEKIGVSRIVIHPDYKLKEYPDIALLELSADSSAPIVSIPSMNNPVAAVGENATVIGWGQISETGPASAQLLETNVTISDIPSCRLAYTEISPIDEIAMICAGTAAGNDSCYGDSGGPLIVSRGSETVQAGVVSFGKECGLASHPGVYARVSSYYDWIASYANVKAYVNNPQSPAEPDGEPAGNGSEPDNDSATNQGGSGTAAEDGFTYSCTGLFCTFTANSGQLDYYWDFGDGDLNFGEQIDHEFPFAGEYIVYLGVVDSNGDYVEYNQAVTVMDTDSDTGTANGIESYSGVLRGRGSQIDLPEDGSTVVLPEGTLVATLSTTGAGRFRVYIDEYDADYDEWFEVSRGNSRNGELTLEVPVEAGEYGFTVMSLNKGGDYQLDVSVQ